MSSDNTPETDLIPPDEKAVERHLQFTASDASAFLVDHHVPIVGPEMGQEMLKILKRLDVVKEVYPLPPTVDAYRLALQLVLLTTMNHQQAFCDHMENLLNVT